MIYINHAIYSFYIKQILLIFKEILYKYISILQNYLIIYIYNNTKYFTIVYILNDKDYYSERNDNSAYLFTCKTPIMTSAWILSKTIKVVRVF